MNDSQAPALNAQASGQLTAQLQYPRITIDIGTNNGSPSRERRNSRRSNRSLHPMFDGVPVDIGKKRLDIGPPF